MAELSLATRLSIVLGVAPAIAQHIATRQATFADLQAAQSGSRFEMDRVLGFFLQPDRVLTERLNPNTLTPDQIQRWPGLSPSQAQALYDGRPFFSLDEVEQATQQPKALLVELLALPIYRWSDKPRGTHSSVSPVPGIYTAIAESDQFEAVTFNSQSEFEAASLPMPTQRVVVLQSQDRGTVANPQNLKRALTGRICPAVRDASGAVRYLVPLSLDLWFDPETSQTRIDAILAALNVQAQERTDEMRAMGYVRVMIPGCPVDTDPLRASLDLVARAEQYDEVVFAEPEQIGLDDFGPSPPVYRPATDSDFETAGHTWNYDAIQLAAAHRITTGSPHVTIFVIDGGIDTTHPALRSALRPDWPRVDLNFTLEDPASALSPHEIDLAHGTQVTSIIAAPGITTGAIQGVAPGCAVLPIKISGTMGYGLRAAAIRQAVRLLQPGHRGIINLSWRTQGEHIGIREALLEADRQGFAIVASAGNYGPWDRQQADALHYPSGYAHRYPHLQSLCAVGATTVDSKRASYSYFGRNSVTVAAPGGDPGQAGQAIYVASPLGDYTYAWGTSFAAPHVAGVLGLMFSRNPHLAAAAAIDLLQSTAQPLAAEEAIPLGRGLINAQAALAAVPVPDSLTVPGAVFPVIGDSEPGTLEPTPLRPAEPQPTPDPPLPAPPKINLNTASATELATIPLFNTWRIEHLLAQRTEQGPLQSLWDLLATGAFNLWVIRQLFDYAEV